jgi:hypothetical protein
LERNEEPDNRERHHVSLRRLLFFARYTFYMKREADKT